MKQIPKYDIRYKIPRIFFIRVQNNLQLSNGKIPAASKYIAAQMQAFCIF